MIVVSAGVLAAWLAWHLWRPAASLKTAAPEVAVAVTTRVIERRDVPLFVDALGSVVPLRSVKLRTQVGGQLLSTPFQEGARVAKGQVIAVIDSRALEARLKQAVGAKARDTALLLNAQTNLVRLRDAWHDGSGTRQAVDTQATQVDQYKAALLIDQGAIDELKVQIGFTRLRAPMAGRIGLRQLDAGNVLADNDPQTVATVDAIAPISVVFPLPQEQVGKVLRAWREWHILPVDALDGDHRSVIERGRLVAIDNAVDASSGTVNLKAVFSNAQGHLMPNAFVDARLSLGTLRQALVVPQIAVRRGRGGDYLYTMNGAQRAVLHRVQRGPSAGGEVVVSADDLRAGERVVVEGADRIEGGTLLSASEAAPDDDEGAAAQSPRPASASPAEATSSTSGEGGAGERSAAQ
ncbi:efflux RND transporter periplasmic adaptor subunit [Burkholderia gladioli]|uniref:efflux RND transporter periplasmic adaptor subunit n=1 Tax=Burkholderia gladioli TaxID=28095 RepID=UPI0016407576|nr:efflux RND transporter periplasmic adaptor subunit [Burkholderia gladioli]